jgi:signal transduction histidine kinase/ActR/RegA family two-component response regulator
MPKGHLPVRSYLSVPVVSRSGEVLGGLFFGHPEPNVFSADAEATLVGLAAQAAISIDNAKLHAALQREVERYKQTERKLQVQLERLAQLDQITRAIAQRQDLRSLFQVLVGSLEEKLPVDFGCVCLYDALEEQLVVAGVGARSEPLARELALGEQERLAVAENGLSRCVQGQLVYEQTLAALQAPFAQRLARAGLGSLVAAPLQLESKVFGVLIVARRTPEGFSSDDCELLRQLSEHAALAVHQVQIYDALRHAYDALHQTQQSAIQQERLRALGQMASGIAHDINNALSPVAVYTDLLLEREADLSPRTREYLETTQRAIGDVAQTVARMAEFYRQREPEQPLRAVELNMLVAQVLELTRARWSDMPQERGSVIQVDQQLAAHLPAVAGVESEIREALVNLIFNAVDAMPEGGALTLRTGLQASAASRAPRSIYVEIEDSGVGMDEQTRTRCLEPFFTTKGERGTGLGLAMVFGVMRRHNAEVEIASELKRGTRVRLSFPLVQATQNPRSVRGRSAVAPRRILLIDDDPLILRSLRDMLEGDGHAVSAASGGQEGIDAVKAAPAGRSFELVVTDLGMPGVDGRRVAAAIKALSPRLPIVLLTGWGRNFVAGDLPPHVDRVLSKPPKLEELRAALEELVTGEAASAESA